MATGLQNKNQNRIFNAQQEARIKTFQGLASADNNGIGGTVGSSYGGKQHLKFYGMKTQAWSINNATQAEKDAWKAFTDANGNIISASEWHKYKDKPRFSDWVEFRKSALGHGVGYEKWFKDQTPAPVTPPKKSDQGSVGGTGVNQETGGGQGFSRGEYARAYTKYGNDPLFQEWVTYVKDEARNNAGSTRHKSFSQWKKEKTSPSYPT